MAAIKKRSLVDQVYERLRSDIITLRLPLGSRVNVNELQDTLGVSCTPIREALNRLQQEGLIEYENNVGARVIALTAKDVEEIQHLATTLHCAAVRLAMERGIIPFGQVFHDNAASLALQRRAGMQVTEHLLFWLM